MMIKGGTRETEVKELTVIPCCSPACEAVTMVTPEVQARIASRICSGSKLIRCLNDFYHYGGGEEPSARDSSAHLSVRPGPMEMTAKPPPFAVFVLAEVG